MMPVSSLKTPHHYPTPWGRANPRPHFFVPGTAQNAANAWENLCWPWGWGRARHPALFLGSSVVEQPAVNRLVAGSIPARGAIYFNSLALEMAVKLIAIFFFGNIPGNIFHLTSFLH
jgi:hypothetical protein